jgi:hypothetical protein
MVPPLQVQQTPAAPEFGAAGIKVPAHIATPQAAMNNVKVGQSELNTVNNFSGGSRRRRRRSGRGRSGLRPKREWKHKSFIRTYKGRKYQDSSSSSSSPQKGGAPPQIVIPQVGSSCSGGPQCAGAQNAAFTSINNQAKSNGANDAYAAQTGGGRSGRKVRFSKRNAYHQRSTRNSRKPRHDQSLTTIIAYNIKKVMRKVFL